MAEKRNRTRLQMSVSLLGGLIIESLSIMAILGLWYVVQDERTQNDSVNEQVISKPTPQLPRTGV